MKICSPIVFEMLWPATDAHTLKEKLGKMIINNLLVNKLFQSEVANFLYLTPDKTNALFFLYISLSVHTHTHKTKQINMHIFTD